MEEKINEKKPLMNAFESKAPFFTAKSLIIFILVAVLGIGTGYFLSSNSGKIPGLGANNPTVNSSKNPKGTTVGSNDTKTFKDTAEGTLEEGGIDGEGQYHLVRPGGDSQNVYLTSSIVDLSQFLKRKVKVWGQTNKAQHAGWLMDVGKLQVLE